MVQYQVSFINAIKRAFSQYCVFTGRASRSEFWWFELFTAIISTLLSIPSIIVSVKMVNMAQTGALDVAALSSTSFVTYLNYLWSVAILLPSLGLMFRRFHDTGRSGWNWLWTFLPIAGQIVLIVLWCQPSQPEANKYGPVPNVME